MKPLVGAVLLATAVVTTAADAQNVIRPRAVPKPAPSTRTVTIVVPAAPETPGATGAPSREERSPAVTAESLRTMPVVPATPQLPFFGTPRPEAVTPPEIVGQVPAGARPDRLPFFGERPAGAPSAHFMDPRIPAAPVPQR